MLIALDPNVYIAASLGHDHSGTLLGEIFEDREYIQVGVDQEQHAVMDEYHRILHNLQGSSRDWLTGLLKGKTFRLVPLSTPIVQQEADFLRRKGCDTPVEPQLIALCAEPGRDAWLVVVGPGFIRTGLRYRGSHDHVILADLKGHFPHLQVLSALQAQRQIAAWVHSGPPFPYSELELDNFLQEYHYREGDQLEFKQPKGDPTCCCFTRLILQSSMKALCAMANTYGGKVLIGVYENLRTGKGQIAGFPLVYNGCRVTEDGLLRMLWDDPVLLPAIKPLLSPDELRYNIIDLANDRKVLVLHVKKCAQTRSYQGGIYYRHGTQNMRHS